MEVAEWEWAIWLLLHMRSNDPADPASSKQADKWYFNLFRAVLEALEMLVSVSAHLLVSYPSFSNMSVRMLFV